MANRVLAKISNANTLKNTANICFLAYLRGNIKELKTSQGFTVKKHTLISGVFTCLLMLSSISLFADDAIPEPLSPWVPWVLKGQEKLICPFINKTQYGQSQNHICAWPSTLDLAVKKHGAAFTQSWQVLSKSIIPLPGDNKNWPQSVTVDKKAVAVFSHQGKPAVELVKGTYQIAGLFTWQNIPPSMAIPEQYAFVKLSINDQVVEFPKIEANDLWLQNFQSKQAKQDAIDISVSRRIIDGAFIKLETFLSINVSGKMREVKLGKPLPDGFELIGIESAVSSFIDGEGILHAKLKPGSWQIKVHAYAAASLLTWSRPESSYHWPNEEIWVFKGDENLRLGKLEGVKMVDSSQADMPEPWYDLPSYLVNAGDSITYDIQHRGKPLHLENQLSLQRTLWLSFDQTSYTFVDEINGSMINGWRLSMKKPYLLESAEDQDGSVLITTTEQGERGVENRYPRVNVQARGTVQASQQLPVTGWDSHFERVSLKLNLPPGHKLLAVFGADSVSNSWWQGWTIWASFIVLLSSLMASRLVTLAAGITTALMLVMIYQETAAPVVAIINVLLAIAIKKHQPFKRIKAIVNAYWMMSVTFAIGAILLFCAMQLRSVIYPQLESKAPFAQQFNDKAFSEQNIVREMSVKRKEKASYSSMQHEDLEVIQVSGSKLKVADSMTERYQSDALMQAGSGIPNWQWHSHQLKWQSPIAQGQEFDVIVLSKTVYSMMKLLGILLSLLWLYLVLKDVFTFAYTKLQTSAITTILALLVFLPSTSSNVHAADFPEQSMLAELKTRVTEAPLCAPNCVAINNLRVNTDAKSLTLVMSVHANANTALAIPKSEFWRPEKLFINDQPIGSLYKHQGWIYIAIAKGISEVTLVGQVAPVDVFQLEFNDKPKHVKVIESAQWQVVGNQENSLTGNTLAFLAKAQKYKGNEQASTRYQTPAFVKVTRALYFDQLWSVRTKVERIAPSNGSINLSIPILSGENITSADVLLDNKQVMVTIPAGEQVFTWHSTIDRQAQLILHAKEQQAFLEHWQVVVSPSWHVSYTGLPIILGKQDNDDYFRSSFYPYPGERLTLDVTRPKAVEGHVLAIDAVNYTIDQGSRTSTLKLSFDYRSTRGGEHIIDLPESYQLKEISTDDKLINLQMEKGKIAIPVLPGSHNVRIMMRANTAETLHLSAPPINLHAPVSNITSVINLSKQRWILWEKGPLLGPAVLYWGELLAFVLLALLVSRVKFSPLNTLHWIVLGFGLSLNNWGILMVVALWFAAITASNYRQKDMGRLAFNSSQLVLYLLSVVAIISLLAVVPLSLLSSPSMGIEGNYSYGTHLQWFADKSNGLLPEVSVLSISTIFYKGLMLVWVIWLSFAFLSWIKWAWQMLGKQGYWRGKAETTPVKSEL